MRTKNPLAAAAAVATALALSACGGGTAELSAEDEPLQVGASPVPHAEILRFVDDELADEAGLDLEIVEFTDYVQPNVALDDGSIDANYFQTVPYLEEQEANAGYDFTALEPVHIEPLGIYSDSLTDLAALPDGATVAIPNDPTNAGRALRLLAANDLITLADTGDAAPTALDVEGNPKNLQIQEIEAAQLPRSLVDVDAAVINGNYAIDADLSPAEDALALEEAEGNPNANLVVVRAGTEDDERIGQLEELLHSDEVRTFIEENYGGAVIPAF
ncbi:MULTISPECIES: MetQ/NlpA family ABC transporter substrate-binding protein [unclassified Modestobacter]|uniref:MetQ/NlpA family ABC transporter substrate-binding protein n=1 Tax=unclassified Modestobacter TaxID=2643866 RepID=UPI0022AA011F|nr:MULTISPECIES: MetQ/NlpA family ABC transporter substrate-binding protein [unclassified Modestobacter]MCZ2813497.1 MetQ/NlpA family ABC transporter substrate-binding protein [Modestobacter sp. VKM Ac-2979]MCZ2842311.1 MetQ/NlpA family ABC transporter substrate-binding protein [Modestobacter sp. VKM Ac-2980]MCZ2846653.1 MetQ/NlpA family ABC transporter substrate-binding protein [Modestobacter sp. VKM Ac-2978]